MTPPAAIILAAGEGRRMGGPKALLMIDGEPLICAHVQRLLESDCRPIVIVIRNTLVSRMSSLLGHASKEVQIVPVDTDSMTASLSCGLACLSPEPSRAVLVSPVDCLPVQRSTLLALFAALASNSTLVATPHYRGRGGHPIVVRESLLGALREGYPGTLRDLVRSAEAQRRRVDVEDVALAGDLDTPADLALLRPGLTPYFATNSHAPSNTDVSASYE